MDIQPNLEKMLQMFVSMSISHKPSMQRESNSLVSLPMPFEINPQSINQFNQLYKSRLESLGKRIDFSKVHKIQQVDGKLGIINIIGIFKRIQVKRLRAFDKDYDIYYKNCAKIYSQNDTLEIEDKSGKIPIVISPDAQMNGRKISKTQIPYGVILGLTGYHNDKKMQFIVNKITLPNLPIQRPIPAKKKSYERKTVIMSSPSIKSIKQLLQTVVDTAQLSICTKIMSIIIIGFSQKLQASQYRQLDSVFQEYMDQIDIHVMPSQKLNSFYPQVPMHPILFSKSSEKINLVNNPQVFCSNQQKIINDDSINLSTLPHEFLLCSGENIRDFTKNCSYGQSSLDNMSALLEYSHISPSSPFSLKCEMMPEDYLVLKQVPHVFIAGNCEKTMQRVWIKDNKKVKLIAIKQGENILFDIDNYEMQKIEISQKQVS